MAKKVSWASPVDGAAGDDATSAAGAAKADASQEDAGDDDARKTSASAPGKDVAGDGDAIAAAASAGQQVRATPNTDIMPGQNHLTTASRGPDSSQLETTAIAEMARDKGSAERQRAKQLAWELVRAHRQLARKDAQIAALEAAAKCEKRQTLVIVFVAGLFLWLFAGDGYELPGAALWAWWGLAALWACLFRALGY